MKLYLVAILTMLGSLAAQAEDKSIGCGVGSMLLPRKSLVSATTAYAINYVLPTSFSVTSGTSGCAAHSIVKQEKRAIHFAEANYDVLEMEIAQGKGEFLNGFASVLGCDQQVFSKTAQDNFGVVMPKNEKSPIQLLNNVQKLIRTTPDLAKACQGQLT